MSRPFSCIVTRTGKVYSQKDDPSHTQIAAENGLPEDGKSELFRAKVEITPNDWPDWSVEPSPEQWSLVVDEETKPDWWGERAERNAWAAARKWWKSRVLRKGEHRVSAGIWIVLGTDSLTITQSGGEVLTFGQSAPTIIQSGGVVWTYNQSAPQITQSGGEVLTFDQSAPTITQSGGVVWTFDQSAPTITQSGGVVWTYNQSAPTITQSGGEVRTSDQSAPTITRVTR